MSPSNTLLFAILVFASISSAISFPPCLHQVSGYFFNLCPFQNPIDKFNSPNIDLNANITLSLTNPTVPSCQNNKTKVWLIAGNDQGDCDTVTTEPELTLNYDIPGAIGLNIRYTLDEQESSFFLKLHCNQTMEASSRVNFTLESVVEMDITFSAHSYFGCPLKSPLGNFLHI